VALGFINANIAAAPTWPQFIELVKVASPIIVAAAVLYFSVQQNRWMRQHASKQLRVEHQAQQIKMLEDRQKIIRTVGGVLARYNHDGSGLDDRNDQLFHVLINGRTVFGDAIGDLLQATWLKQVEHHNLRLPLVRSIGMPQDDTLVQRRADAEEGRKALFADIQMLYEKMIAAARYDAG
jgi:hypothetical protein